MENVIEFLNGQKRATVTLSQGRYKTKVEKLAKERPDECKILTRNPDGTILAHVPTSWVKISPPRKVEMSEDRKEELRKQLANARNKKEE